MAQVTAEQVRQRPFMDRALTVAVHTRILFASYLEFQPVVVDNLSVFSADEADYEDLTEQASHLGEAVADKNGLIYRLRLPKKRGKGQLPTDIVRIRQPGKSEALIGSADFLVPSYAKARAGLVGHDDYTERLGGSYQVLKISNPKAMVTLYLPSRPLTESLGIIEA